MEINTANHSNSPLITPQTLAEQKKITSTPKNPSQNPATTDDALTLSNSSLTLSQLTNQQTDKQTPQITSGAQAQKVADRIVSGMQSNPIQAKQAYGNLIHVNLKPLLG